MAIFDNTALVLYAEKLIKLRGQDDKTFKLVLDNKTIRDLITFLNTEDQFGQDHVNAIGQKLTNLFSGRTTYSLFDKKGRGGQPYELFDSGDYWESFKATVNAGNIVITSNPFKGADDLTEMFGPHLEGLTDENLQVLIDESLKQYINWYEKNLLPG